MVATVDVEGAADDQPHSIAGEDRARAPKGSATLSTDSQLVRTADEAPVLVAAGNDAPEENVRRLVAAGCEAYIRKPLERTELVARLREFVKSRGPAICQEHSA